MIDDFRFMNNMNDKELDLLFAESAHNKQAVEQINRQVMKTVRRDMRMKIVRQWARMLGLCFGVPMLVVVYVYILFAYMPDIPQWLMYICYALPLGTLAALYGKNLHDFSPFEV